jgi:hypothetical protein
MKPLTKLTSAFLLLAATAAAQMTITNVTNAASPTSALLETSY